MHVPSPLRPVAALFSRTRPALFSPVEWRFHWLCMPAILPIGAYCFMGWRYFQEPVTFFVGTIANAVVYWTTIFLFTLIIHRIIRWFPTPQQVGIRLLVMFLVVGVAMMGLAVMSVWLFSVVPGTGTRFDWATIWTLWGFGTAASTIFCVALSTFYVHTQWHNRQTENEQLKQQALQQQYDLLKGQINPHFLFNSLNSVSSLIADDPQRAEALVDELSKVYRYMLQVNQKPLTELGAEIRFIRSYVRLLEARYGAALQLRIAVQAAAEPLLLPPLSLQLLLDHICQHNALTMTRPLHIRIETSEAGQLWVRHTRQTRTVLMDRQLPGIDALAARYNWLGSDQLLVEETERQITIGLPLLPVNIALPPPLAVQPAESSVG